MPTKDILLSRKEKLFDATSVASFRSQPIEIYRHTLNVCLQELTGSENMNIGSDESGYWRQASIRWADNLELPWKDLCEHHDRHNSLRTKRELVIVDESTTPLHEFVGMLLNPSIVPRAHIALVVKLLLEALLESPRRTVASTPQNVKTTTRWTQSQLLLLLSIQTAWKACPSLNHTFWNSCVSSLLESQKHQTAHKWNRLLSVAHHIATDCPLAHCTMTKFILDILSRVDTMEEILIQKRARESREDSPPRPSSLRPCEHCMVHRELRRRKRPRLATLLQLHDQDITSHGYRPLHLPLPQTSNSAVSLRDVLTSKVHIMNSAHSQCKCLTPTKEHDSSDRIKHSVSDDWTTVRMRAYKKFHALYRRPPSVSLRLQHVATGWTMGEPCQFDLHSLLRCIRHNYRSPCLRLCLLMVTFSAESTVHCVRLCRLLWAYFLSSSDPIWLRIYCEVVVTWSCLNDQQACWDAIAPLVTYIKRAIDERQKDEFTEVKEGESNRHRPVFQCMAHILSRRSRLLAAQVGTVSGDFISFIKTLELHCGDMETWFEPRQQQGPADCLTGEVSTLHRLGILGLTSLIFDDDTEYATNPHIHESESEMDPSTATERQDGALVQWPFSDQCGLHAAYHRVGEDGRRKFNEWDKLLTDPDYEKDIPLGPDAFRDVDTAPPMADYVHHSELLLQIFHFSSYQDIVRCRQVCQWWKAAVDSSNDFWWDVYRFHFPVHPLDPLWPSTDRDAENWKGHFVVKVINERNLFHRRHHGTGYKHRTCPFIGCSHVLKSQRLEEMHLASHIKGAAKKVASSTKEEGKQAKQA